MPGPGWRRLVVAELAPIDDLEAALLAVVRGQIREATLQRVAELLGGRRLTEPGGGLPGALWALTQPLAQVVEARVAPRVGGEVVWAEAVLRVARDDGRAVIVGPRRSAGPSP